MGLIVALVGGVGAALALVGALVAMFTGGLGFSTGVDDSGAYTGRAFGALLISFVGFGGALTARARLRLGAGILIMSSIVGVLLVAWFFVPGAVLLLTGAAMAFWPDGTSSDAR